MQRVRVDEHTIEVAGTPVFYRTAPVPGDRTTPLYIHGVPMSSDDWTAALEQTGGLAPDLIGFGRSGKAEYEDYTLAGLAAFLERLLTELGIRRISLIAHDWGAGAALVLAQRHPERIERLVLCDAVPLLESFEWHRVGRVLRIPAVGELVMGSTPRWLLARILRGGCVDPGVFPDARVKRVWEQFDNGTQRAILRLFRSAGARELAAAGLELSSLRMPALVIWGEQDPWLGERFATAYGERLRNAEVIRIRGAGHWPWLESDRALKQIVEFIRG